MALNPPEEQPFTQVIFRQLESPFIDGSSPLFARPSGNLTFSISQFGITWTFSDPVKFGQFANGDYWVVDNGDGVELASKTPAWTTLGSGSGHGTMFNQLPDTDNGYDTRIQNNIYSASKNIEDPLHAGGGLPYTVVGAGSIISAISNTADAVNNNPQLSTVVVLTVLASEPAAGSFRPPYIGTDKTIIANISDLDYTQLATKNRTVTQNLIDNTPPLATVEAEFERVWIEAGSTWKGRHLHPELNMPNYGREIGYATERGCLSLQLDYTDAEKETLLIRIVQYGIDLYGSAVNGMEWTADGGHNQGRKMPLLLAAKVLNNSAMLAFCDKAINFIFQDDQQIFSVSEADAALTHLPQRTGYVSDPSADYDDPGDIGLAEWGPKHLQSPTRDDKDWAATYRLIAGSATIGGCLCAHLMSVKTEWNYATVFTYYEDRYWPTEQSNRADSSNEIQLFTAAIWDNYGAT